VTGKISPEEYQARSIGFYTPAQEINKLGGSSKIALYDEVFGFLLDVPYYWANPGHSTQIPYDSMTSGEDYAAAMKKMGFTHAYVNTERVIKGPELAEELTMGFRGQPLSPERRTALMASWEQKFNPLLIEAVQGGFMTVEQAFGNPERPRAILLKFN
jgi:hypothetical protein